jgi:hypothetical protein
VMEDAEKRGELNPVWRSWSIRAGGSPGSSIAIARAPFCADQMNIGDSNEARVIDDGDARVTAWRLTGEEGILADT